MDSMINYGDIVVMDFNPTKGAEITKIRPCIVLSRLEINQYSRFFVVAPFTTNTKIILAYHLHVLPSPHNGLQHPSKAMLEQIRSLDKTRFIKKLGSLERRYLPPLSRKLQFVLNQNNA